MKKNLIMTATTVIASAVLPMTASPITCFAAVKTGISAQEALQIALNSAGLKESEVTIVKNGIEIDDGITEYDIKFYSGNMEYDYDIDATTGAIRSFDQEVERGLIATPGQAAKTSPKAQTQAVAAQAASAQAATEITKEQALQIALDHAGLKKSDVAFSKVKKDFDDGRQQYDVEFHVGFNEYNYDIDASTGQIVDFDIDD